MYILKQAFIEICKIFLISFVCSMVFVLMIYRDSALPNIFICLILNTTALLLFLYLNYQNWSRLYMTCLKPVEFFVPTISATAVYALVSSYFYSKRVIFYMWLFLPTRFMEPIINRDAAFTSVVVTYSLLLILAFMTPQMVSRRR